MCCCPGIDREGVDRWQVVADAPQPPAGTPHDESSLYTCCAHPPCCCSGAHEWGHWWAADRQKTQLYLPFVVPAGFGFLGSFGAITRIRGFAPSREALLDIGASGPLIGTAVSGALVLIGEGVGR